LNALFLLGGLAAFAVVVGGGSSSSSTRSCVHVIVAVGIQRQLVNGRSVEETVLLALVGIHR